jgi:hypothetical protein
LVGYNQVFARGFSLDSTKCISPEKNFRDFFESISAAVAKNYMRPDSNDSEQLHIDSPTTDNPMKSWFKSFAGILNIAALSIESLRNASRLL